MDVLPLLQMPTRFIYKAPLQLERKLIPIHEWIVRNFAYVETVSCGPLGAQSSSVPWLHAFIYTNITFLSTGGGAGSVRLCSFSLISFNFY